MFAEQYQYKYASKYTRRRRPGPKRWLAVFLLCTLVLFSTLDPFPTFSRYMVNLQEMFNLNTSNFYLTPSLNDNQLTYDWDLGFTENTVLVVANSSGSNVTTHDMHYTITLNEAGPNPLFDLYLDDGQGVKTLCENNVINGTLTGENALSNSYTLCIGLKEDSVLPEQEVSEVSLVVASSQPYIRSYTFKVYIGVEEQEMIVIPGTDIERPNVEIPEGEIMVFKDTEYEYLTIDDLMVPLVVDTKVDDLGRPDLVGGSLYVPATTGDLFLQQGNKVIDWDVAGHVILEPNIVINNNSEVNIISRYGDVIFNESTISGQPSPYNVNITALEGNIEGHGSTIVSKANSTGVIKFQAENDVILSESSLTSGGDTGVQIISESGNIDVSSAAISSTNGSSGISINSPGQISASGSQLSCVGDDGIKILGGSESIDASNAIITSTNGAATASVVIQSVGPINLDGARVESRSSIAPPTPALLIESTDDGISAKSAILTSTNSGKLLKIAAQGFIELDQTTVSSGGPITISTSGNISAIGAALTAASNGGLLEVLAQGFMELDQATLSSGGNINISTLGDISAKSVNMSSAGNGNGIQLTSTNGAIDLSALEVVSIPQTIISSPGNIKIHAHNHIDAISTKISATNLNYTIKLISTTGQIDVSSSQVTGIPITDITSADNILIKAGQDIHCISSKITASSNWGKQLRFESTGAGSKLWVNNANLGGYSILAVGLQIQGTPANGNIQ